MKMKQMIAVSPLQTADKTIWRAEDRPCPVCGSTKRERRGRRGGRAHREGKGIETNVVQCLDCVVLYTNPTLIPDSNPYATETAEEYFQLHSSEQRVKNGESLADYAESIIGKPGRMLELGCGRGELLAGAANRGWTVYGVEMTENYAQVAESRGVLVERSSIQQSKLLDQTYDVILMAAILEHLYDPFETLKKVRDALRPGGLVFIDVPNELSLTMCIGNLYMRAQGKDAVVNLSPTFSPFHVVGFSPASLRRALSAAGFRVHTLETPKWNNALPEGGSLLKRIERFVFGTAQTIGARIGMGDGVACWAVRE